MTDYVLIERPTGFPHLSLRRLLVPFIPLVLLLGLCLAVPASADEVLLVVNRFEIEGENPLSAEETQSILQPYLGEHRSLDSLEAAALALENRIRDSGRAFYRVFVPTQKPADNVVRLQIARFNLDTIEVTGNEHFSAENILRALPSLRSGESPDVKELGRELSLANEHPSKRMRIAMKKSPGKDAVDAEVKVQDIDPSSFFVGLIGGTRDRYNAINQNTGYTRLMFGYQNTNLFDRDHALTVSYATSPDHPDDVQQYGLFYWIPLYGQRASLSFSASRSDVDTGTIGVGPVSFDVSGRGTFYGVRFNYALPKLGEWSQTVSAALDDKHFESTTVVSAGSGGVAIPTPAIRSRPLTLRYLARREQVQYSMAAYAEYAHNLSGGGDNNAASYAATRPNADRDWQLLRFGFDGERRLNERWKGVLRLRGQYADEPLIPGEQFGIGGSTSVRGLRDREFTGDSGMTLSLEALGPALYEAVHPVLFADYGYARLEGPTALTGLPDSTPNDDDAASLGVGVRWNYRKKLTVSADLAFVVKGLDGNGAIPGTDKGHQKLHFLVLYRF